MPITAKQLFSDVLGNEDLQSEEEKKAKALFADVLEPTGNEEATDKGISPNQKRVASLIKKYTPTPIKDVVKGGLLDPMAGTEDYNKLVDTSPERQGLRNAVNNLATESLIGVIPKSVIKTGIAGSQFVSNLLKVSPILGVVDKNSQELKALADALSKSYKVEQATAKKTQGVSVSLEKGLNDELFKLKTNSKADEIIAIQKLKQSKVSPEDMENIYHNSDALEVTGKEDSTSPLTQKQRAIYEQEVKPIQQENQELYNKVKAKGQNVSDEELHTTRYTKGSGNIFDTISKKLEGYASRGGSTSGILNKTAGFLKKRTMKALVDEQGNRLVASIKNGFVNTFIDGKPMPAGKLNLKIYEDLLSKEIKPIEDNIRSLTKKKQYWARSDFKVTPQEKRIDTRIEQLESQKQDIMQKYDPNNLNGKVFFDKNGNKWTIKDATVKEIEKNTSIKYHKNILLNELYTNTKLKKIKRAMDFMESLKQNPEFNSIARKIGNTEIPQGWKTAKAPNFRGYAFDPKIADKLDWFFNKNVGGADTEGFLNGLNSFLRNSIFFNPLIHIPNIANHWLVNRGVVWGIKNLPKLSSTAKRAWQATMTQNEDYLKMLQSGVNLLYADQNENLYKLMQEKMLGEVQKNHAIAKALGYANPLNWIKAVYKFSGKATWAVNDIATLQAIYEEMANGKTIEKAIEDVGKHIPNYRVPENILGSKELQILMTNPNISMFGAYHYGALRSYGEMLKSLAKGSAIEKLETLDKMAMIGLMGYVVYPFLDDRVREISGNKNATVRRAGASSFFSNLDKLIKDEIEYPQLLQATITPAPIAKLLVELFTGRNTFTGKPAINREQIPQDIASLATSQIAPIAQIVKASQSGENLKKVGYGLLGITMPKNSPQEQARVNKIRNLSDVKHDQDIVNLQNAEKKIEQIKSLPNAQAKKSKLLELYKTNPDMLKKVIEIREQEIKGVASSDRMLKTLGAEKSARFLYDEIMSKPKEQRTEYYKSLIHKFFITDKGKPTKTLEQFIEIYTKSKGNK